MNIVLLFGKSINTIDLLLNEVRSKQLLAALIIYEENVMRILYIDPWCANGSNLYYYSTGLAEAMSEFAELTLVCCGNFDLPEGHCYDVAKLFFTKSNLMKRGKIRLLVRGFEYVLAYIKIVKFVKKNTFDVIHIEWPLLYKVDKLFYKKLKKYCRVLSLKAHNVLPHSSQQKYLGVFKEIYSIPDVVLVHGKNMRDEFSCFFPEMVYKVRIQQHGIYLDFNCKYDLNEIDNIISQKMSYYSRVYLFCGRIDYDKGVDRLARIWAESFYDKNSLLVIAGAVSPQYDFDSVRKCLSNCDNVLFIEGYVSDCLFNYLLDRCNLVILPYRAGSMSGVVFTAAEFSKPLLSTNFGVVDEYLIDKTNSFIVNNDDELLKEKLIYIDSIITKDELSRMGASLKEHIHNTFSWKQIGNKLVNEIYCQLLDNKEGE